MSALLKFESLFQAADCPEAYGNPALDWESDWAKIQKLTPELQRLSNFDFKILDDPVGCQDGAMLGEVGIEFEISQSILRPKWRYHFVSFEFSGYGHFFRYRCDISWPLIPDDTLKSMIDFIASSGFVFVPAEAFNMNYSGVFDFEDTWGKRFFEKYW